MKVLQVEKPQLNITWPEDVTVVPFTEGGPIPSEHQDAEAVILWGMRGEMQAMVDSLPAARWYQTFAAGPDALLACNFKPGTVITNGANFHDRPVAEHALASALYLVRRLGAAADAQKRHEWDRSLAPFAPLHDGVNVTTLVDSRVVVWGFGAIGTQIGRVFSAVGANVTGVARSSGERDGFPVVTEDELEKILPDTDVLVMVLPDSPSTRGVLNSRVLAQLPRRALVVNVGRGSAVDEAALISALRNGTLAGAALDVVSTEPLPSDNHLWDVPNLFITPHMAGGRPDGAVERIEHNFDAWRRGDLEAMIGVVKVAD